MSEKLKIVKEIREFCKIFWKIKILDFEED